MTTLTSDAQVAGAAAAAAAAARGARSVIVSPGCVPAGISTGTSPSRVGTCDRRAERGERRGHVDHRDEVVAVAHEALVLADADDDVQVAGRPAALAGVAAAR